MYVQVRLLKGFQEPLWYELPQQFVDAASIGTMVKVPIQRRIESAVVEQIVAEKPTVGFHIRSIITCEPFPHDEHYYTFIRKLSDYYQVSALFFLKRLRQFLQKNEMQELAFDSNDIIQQNDVVLSDEQRNTLLHINSTIVQDKLRYCPIVLHGVTGSGKTEIYKYIVKKIVDEDKSVIWLFPEVSLAVQFTNLLRKQLAEYSIISFHSATSISEKRQLWQSLLKQRPVIIVGVHLPILLPISNLGLIIIDEEHDVGYQEKKYPRINTKEAALIRAQLLKIPIIMGSATPSISTLYNVHHKGWHFFQLKKRYAGTFPTMKVVSLLSDKRRPQFWITKDLANAIRQRLNKKEQIILFLNRRGFSFFVQCKACSFVFGCSHCSVSLTLHEHEKLTCHYCNYIQQLPSACPSCASSEFLKKGIGTQQLVSIVQHMFPEARVARADLDATVNKKKWQNIIADMHRGNIDILIGTQTITKGYHFPQVTLVGIIWADLNIHFPIYNAVETTLQQLIQVAGRAGRQSLNSDVIVQTMVEHPVYQYLHESDYLSFYAYEVEHRIALGYPPAQRFVEIQLRHNDESVLEREAADIVHRISELIEKQKFQVQVLGPAHPPIHKIKGVLMKVIYIKSQSMHDSMYIFQEIKKHTYMSMIFFTPNPVG